MKLSIKNRIALFSVIGIAGLSTIVFIAIYFSVKQTVYNEIDEKLKFEVQKHINEIIYDNDSVYFAYKDEWLEREHLEIEVYPLFVELFDENGISLDKSPNLQSKEMNLDLNQLKMQISNERLGGENVRQIQVALEHNSELEGFFTIAVPLRDAKLVIKSLQESLLIIFPILLIITFFTSRFISRITIKPITFIAKTVQEIKTSDLTKRVPEMSNGDELESLSNAINDFLDRIDAAIKREKQFTADASHQLRTPLSVIKGNLEVLIRKPRQTEEYIETIKSNIGKIDEMTDAVEKLLTLARLNSNQALPNDLEETTLNKQLEAILTNYKLQILKKQLSISFETAETAIVITHKTYLNLILDNLISNAIKYAFEKSTITISITESETDFKVSICNRGPQIKAEEFNEIFNPFYRNKNHENQQEGYGLGLAIVAKASKQLNIQIQVQSEENTCFSLRIPKLPLT